MGNPAQRSCETCTRWAGRGNFGRCEVTPDAPKPYWYGVITRHYQLDTHKTHGTECKAWMRR